jgi:hypothetical protein
MLMLPTSRSNLAWLSAAGIRVASILLVSCGPIPAGDGLSEGRIPNNANGITSTGSAGVSGSTGSVGPQTGGVGGDAVRGGAGGAGRGGTAGTGVDCGESQTCDRGYRQAPPNVYCAIPNSCYEKELCGRSIVCIPEAYPAVCSGTWSDGGDAGTIPCCGDGIFDPISGERCDLGSLNGVCLDDYGGNPTDAGLGNPGDAGCPSGTSVFCTTRCQISSGGVGG